MFNSYLIVQIIFPIFMKECLRCGQQDYTTIMSVFYFLSFQDFQYITAYQDQHLNRELWEPEVLQFENAETVLSYSLHKTRRLIMQCVHRHSHCNMQNNLSLKNVCLQLFTSSNVCSYFEKNQYLNKCSILLMTFWSTLLFHLYERSHTKMTWNNV